MFKDTIQLKAWFKESVDLFEGSRINAKKAFNYLFGDQLDNNVKMILTERGQPEQWENNIAKIDKKIVGFLEDRNTEIKLFGTQREDFASAEIMQNIIRAENNANDFDEEKRASSADMRFAGVAVQRVRVEEDSATDKFGRKHKYFKIENEPIERVFLDPYNTKKDYSEAKYIHIAYWIDKDDLYEDFGDKVDTLQSFYNFTEDSELNEEDSTETTRSRVLVIETWYRQYNKTKKKNSWYYSFWSDDIILDNDISPDDDEIGNPFIVEFLHNPKRKKGYAGIYFDVIPKQDAVNFAILRLHNMLGNIKMLVQQDSVEDIAIFKDEFNEDNAIVEVTNIGGIKDIPQNSERQQLLNIIMDGRNQIKELLGVNDEFLAMANNRMSGEAIQQRLNVGTLGLGEYMLSCSNLQKRTLRKVISMITKYYDSNKIMQIIEPDLAQVEYFEINKPITDEAGFVQYEQDGESITPKVENSLKNGRYDLIYKEAPKALTTTTERYRQNVELLKVVQNTAPELVPEFAAELLKDSEGALAKRLLAIMEEKKLSQQQNPMNQVQMQEVTLRLQKLASEIELNKSKAQSNMAKPQIELQKVQNIGAKNRQEQTKNEQKMQLELMKEMSKGAMNNGYNY